MISPTELVAVDVGGTHARFALAEVTGRRVTALHAEVTLHTADHASFETAWAEFARRVGRPLPPAAAIAFAGPVLGAFLKLTNNPWVIRPAILPEQIKVEQLVLLNDFGAVAHAVAQLGPEHFQTLHGPSRRLPDEGVISIVGPGTGLGVAQLLRRDGRAHVIETEGGHIDFAPLDPLEDRILQHLRTRFRRVSAERLAAGTGLANIYEALCAVERRPVVFSDDKALWAAALDGSDALAAATLDRFCLILGAVAGDIALAQGAAAVVIAGGLGLRLADHLPRSGFSDRFVAKGRFEPRMRALPVKLVTHPQPGLFGAAAAFAERYG